MFNDLHIMYINIPYYPIHMHKFCVFFLSVKNESKFKNSIKMKKIGKETKHFVSTCFKTFQSHCGSCLNLDSE